ncbi:MAG: YebC/PmpR family DNA-binding transcriptional regulator, partial [Dehalococcoidia bacterium]|nr:YebC/PmpR family DNA-binding transcriptional regulator [Dehalococcoidia bacterium]
VTIAARSGVPDPDLNFRLRLAVQKARDNNMPAENIERAIKRATGAVEGGELVEVMYEGYGPGGVALLIEAATDNRNRTVAEVRSTLTRGGGSLGEAGSVAWQFANRGVITIATDGADPAEVALKALDLGAEDAQESEDEVTVYTEPGKLEALKKAIEDAKLRIINAEVAMIPRTQMTLDEKDAIALVKLLEQLEDLDDVQRVFSNAEFDAAILSKIA